MNRKYGLCVLLVMSASLSARGAEREAAAPTAYQDVMRAQYAARENPLPVRPEEAQRIYDSYLRSIGQPARDHATDAGGNTGMTPH